MGCNICQNKQTDSVYEIVSTTSKKIRREEAVSSLKKGQLELEKSIFFNEDEYRNDLYILINSIRQTPSEFVPKVKSMIENIYTTDKDKSFLNYSSANTIHTIRSIRSTRTIEGKRISLNKGKVEFEETILFLNSLLPLNKLIINKDFEIDVEELKSYFIKNDSISINQSQLSMIYLSKYKDLLQKGYKIAGFHYDFSPIDSNLSLLLQIVDDNNSNKQRRSSLFDLEVSCKYFGISLFLIDDMVFSLYFFGNDFE